MTKEKIFVILNCRSTEYFKELSKDFIKMFSDNNRLFHINHNEPDYYLFDVYTTCTEENNMNFFLGHLVCTKEELLENFYQCYNDFNEIPEKEMLDILGFTNPVFGKNDELIGLDCGGITFEVVYLNKYSEKK